MNSIIDRFTTELSRKNIIITTFINKSQKLPYCRKNLFLTILTCWDKYVTNICYDIISGRSTSIANIHFRCKEFIQENSLANTHFTDFYFALSTPIEAMYRQRIEKLISTDIDRLQKISTILHLFIEFINLLYIYTECFEIDCSVLGNNRLCSAHQCKNEPNIITLMITDEFINNPEVLDEIINALKYIEQKDKVLLIIDYRNLCSYVDNYSWEGSNAYCRYQKCKQFVYDIYFYKCSCVNFGKYYNELKDKIVRDRQAYIKLRERWKEMQQSDQIMQNVS